MFKLLEVLVFLTAAMEPRVPETEQLHRDTTSSPHDDAASILLFVGASAALVAVEEFRMWKPRRAGQTGELCGKSRSDVMMGDEISEDLLSQRWRKRGLKGELLGYDIMGWAIHRLLENKIFKGMFEILL